MKYCPFCGVGLQDNMSFCPACGKRFLNASVGVEEQTESIEEKEVAEDAFPPIEHTDLSQSKAKKKARGGVFAGIAAIIALLAVVLAFFPSKNTVEELCNSVLYLELYDDFDSMIGSASGFIIQDGKTLVTNYHVIDGTYHIVAKTADGAESTVADTVLAYDEKLDLAILECEKDLGVLPIPLGDSDRAKQGDKVYAIGYPLGLANTLSDGVISSVYNDNGVDTIQTTAAISHGSSGGVLLNKRGEAIGVTAAYYEDGQNLNLAIPINYVKELIKNPKKTTLGSSKVTGQKLSSIDDLQGVWVSTFGSYQVSMSITGASVNISCTRIDDGLSFVPEDNHGTISEQEGTFVISWAKKIVQNSTSVVIEYTGDSLKLNCIYTDIFYRK